jgi:CDP-paratose 2-epimerase
MKEALQPPPRAFGVVEWFRPGEHERVLAALDGMGRAGVSFLRTHLSWAEYHRPGGEAWYDWLIPTLAERIELLPCVHYTPPSLSRTGRASGPPRRLLDYADFVDHVLSRYGSHFPHVELWNEPNNLLDWDWRLDHDWMLFSEMIGAAAHWAGERGWKVVLGGPCPFDAAWLDLMGARGVLAKVSALGVHGFPGTWDSEQGAWEGWPAVIGGARAVLDRYNPAAEVWITETGYSTWRHDEIEQVRRFDEALSLGADRVYWYGWQDVPRDVPVQEGAYFDPRHYHLGAVTEGGRPKLLGRLLAEGGAGKAGAVAALAAPAVRRPGAAVAITGGAGFIGSNLADALLSDGERVLVVDNLSRPGVEENLAWLRARHGGHLGFAPADLRDPAQTREALRGAAAVFHLAAQTAVTTSLVEPEEDFQINAAGTLNVLEALRRDGGAPVVFASTNKVYGGLEDLPLIEEPCWYVPADAGVRTHGVGEEQPLDFCTPYGCSKGVADQYVLDYARTFGLSAAVLRMSCIYGPRQFGTEDQGWVGHFLISALRHREITIYGDGKQVRDILYVADAVAAYRAVLARIGALSGRAFNLGGGPANAVSLRMVLDHAAALLGRELPVADAGWRPGDQLYFVADTRRLQSATGWRPRVPWREGVARLADWLREHRPATAEPAEARA